MRSWLLVVSAVALPAPVAAQETAEFLVEARGHRMRVSGSAATSGAPLNGFTYGVGAEARWWWLVAQPRYQEGSVRSNDGSARWDVIEGELMLGLRPVRWVTVSAGPLIRSYLTPDGTRRTVAWQGRARLETLLLVRDIRSYLDVWRVMSARANTVQLVHGGYGGEGGLRFSLPGTPVTLSASYRIDRTDFGGGLWVEAVEAVAVSLGLGFGPRPR